MWSQMTSAHKGQLERVVENPEDPVLELIHLVVNAVLHEEELTLASEMVHYQRNLSW